jgi:hypothetical protein
MYDPPQKTVHLLHLLHPKSSLFHTTKVLDQETHPVGCTHKKGRDRGPLPSNLTIHPIGFHARAIRPQRMMKVISLFLKGVIASRASRGVVIHD